MTPSNPTPPSEPGGPPSDGERTPYTPDGQSLRVLLGALAVGAAVGVGLLLLVLLT